jgi:hypothetical protein
VAGATNDVGMVILRRQERPGAAITRRVEVIVLHSTTKAALRMTTWILVGPRLLLPPSTAEMAIGLAQCGNEVPLLQRVLGAAQDPADPYIPIAETVGRPARPFAGADLTVATAHPYAAMQRTR